MDNDLISGSSPSRQYASNALGQVLNATRSTPAVNANTRAVPLVQAKDARIRQANLQALAKQGYFGIHTLSNGYTIGHNPAAQSDKFFAGPSHVLISPQGGDVLYGNSPADLLRRGFSRDENVRILGHDDVIGKQATSEATYPGLEARMQAVMPGER